MQVYAGAVLSYTDGTAKTATADGAGLYSFTVSYNWSGTVTPAKAGFVFTPVNIPYTNVLADMPNQDYAATPSALIILGNTGVGGVTLSWFDGVARSTVSSSDGDYFFRSTK